MIRYFHRITFLSAIGIAIAVAVAFDLFWNWDARAAWADLHPGIAAWVQAIGSIVAIAAAAFIAGRQQRGESRIRRETQIRRARVVAARIAPMIELIEQELKRIRGAIPIHNYGLLLFDIHQNKELAAKEAKKQVLFNMQWRDNIYDHFETLPSELSQPICLLLYEVYDYDRIVGALLDHGAQYGRSVILDLGTEQILPALDHIEMLLGKISSPLLRVMRQ